MPLFMCTECGSVDNTATSGYWAQKMRATEVDKPFDPKCSACNPEIGHWHGVFPRKSAVGYKQDRRGHFLYTPEEASNAANAGVGPFTDVVLPASENPT